MAEADGNRMYLFYSIVYTLVFLLMLPSFLLNRQKYASGFRQRLGNYPKFKHDGRKVIWLHCVSVGETNAARPLVERLREAFRDHRLVISTTTKTGHELARNVFADSADAVFYFPFDWKFSVRRSLENYKPSLILLMETEIWPRFIREAKKSGAKVAIVNGRLSEKSFYRYSKIRTFISCVLGDVDQALMQGEQDANRIVALGLDQDKAAVTGNLKFDHSIDTTESELTEEFCRRFGIDGKRPLIVAASTHEPEEQWILESLDGIGQDYRLLIAPRHPNRFEDVSKLLESRNQQYVRRSNSRSGADQNADVILFDSIGELRSIFPLADIVFMGGSLIPHGGQSVLEPAAAGRAIVTGPFTSNFEAVVKEFLKHDALIQTPEVQQAFQIAERLKLEFAALLSDPDRRQTLGENASDVMAANRGAALKT
ncbi:MAG: 3-deoxy-D-manno-octulosonic acid transferase, partial [Pyrinomonadaceae bacterium]